MCHGVSTYFLFGRVFLAFSILLNCSERWSRKIEKNENTLYNIQVKT